MFDVVLVLFCAFFRVFFTSTCTVHLLLPWLNLEQACSTATTYSLTGGFLGLMTNLGPQDNSLSCSTVRGVLDRFFTHFLVSIVMLSVLMCCPSFEWPLFFHCKFSNFCFCLCITLLCRHSMTLFIKVLHSSKVFWSSPWSLSLMVSFNSSIHVSRFIMSNSRVLFMDLMHSFSNCLSALLIIWRPFDVFMLVFSLILTGITSDLRHFMVNLQWFL